MKTTILGTLSLLILTAIFLTGCTSPVRPPEGGELVQSAKARETAPVVPEADLTELVTGNTRFAVELYKKLAEKDTDKNLFYSPYSISIALAMTYAGARNNTEQEMASTLHFMPQDRLHPAFNALDLELAKRGENGRDIDGNPMRLNIVNALWGQQGYTFLPEFLDALAVNYGAGMRLLDFVAQPEESRQTINNWVSYYTEGKITELIPQGAIGDLTRLVLTNAIYFNAAWKHPFKETDTHDGDFNLLDGSRKTAKMMHQTKDLKYAEGSGYQAVELPYDGEELSMVVFLPAAGTFSAFETAFSPEVAADILSKLASTKVNLAMPKFKNDYAIEMKEILTEMGMPLAFSESADFSGMTGQPDLTIAHVLHKAYVMVGEKGTEAAAATAVIMNETSAPLPEQAKAMTIDRPFIFIIRDIKTQSILFLGRILNPES